MNTYNTYPAPGGAYPAPGGAFPGQGGAFPPQGTAYPPTQNQNTAFPPPPVYT